MRLQLIGNYTLEEFQDAISHILKDFKTNEVDSFRNVNIYFGPCINHREIELTNDGDLVEHMIYDLRKRRQVSMLSNELSVVTTHKVEKKSAEEE